MKINFSFNCTCFNHFALHTIMLISLPPMLPDANTSPHPQCSSYVSLHSQTQEFFSWITLSTWNQANTETVAMLLLRRKYKEVCRASSFYFTLFILLKDHKLVISSSKVTNIMLITIFSLISQKKYGFFFKIMRMMKRR